jgi:hypothetical protein
LTSLGTLGLVDKAVDVVLDGVVTSSGEVFGDAGPGRSVLAVEAHDALGLVPRDGIVPECRVEVLVVPLPTLLCVPRAHEGGDGDPVLGSRL